METISDKAIRMAMIDNWIQRDTERLEVVEKKIDALLTALHDQAHLGAALQSSIKASQQMLQQLETCDDV